MQLNLCVRFRERKREMMREEKIYRQGPHARRYGKCILLFPLIFEFLWPSPHLPPRTEENQHKVCVPLLDMPLRRRGGRERVRAHCRHTLVDRTQFSSYICRQTIHRTRLLRVRSMTKLLCTEYSKTDRHSLGGEGRGGGGKKTKKKKGKGKKRKGRGGGLNACGREREREGGLCGERKRERGKRRFATPEHASSLGLCLFGRQLLCTFGRRGGYLINTKHICIEQW